jgi:hypothetical protein
MKKLFLSLAAFNLFIFFIFAQSHISTQSHQGGVNKLISIPTQNVLDYSYFSIGEDGFLIKWSDDNQGEHYQISDVGIKLIAVSPNGNDIAVYETDGGSVNKVSIWDWRNLSRKWQKKYTDSITSINFSAKGTYLIVGTATVDGAEFINTTNWSKVNKIKSDTGIVNYIKTSDSEKTVLFYSPSGNLSYYNMQNGQLKEKFQIIRGLSQPLLYNNNVFFAGVKDNIIYIINAYEGTTVSTINAQNPIILSSSNDSNLYYLEYDGRNNYELKMLENLSGQKVSNPRNVKTLKGPRGNASIATGLKQDTNIVLGSRSGSIYKIDTDPSLSTIQMEEITENIYSKIYDMTPAEEDFYFLTEKAVYKSSYDTGKVDKLAATDGQTNIISYNTDNVILWTKSSRNPVVRLNLQTKQKDILFTPKNNIQSLRLSSIGDKKYLIEIESNTTLNLYDFTNKNFFEVYSGTGIQDAVLNDNGKLYIAKTAASNPKVPLLRVDIDSLETVPMSLEGNVSYALSTDGNMIYGIVLQSDNNIKNTYVYSFNTQTNKATNILKFSEEDSEAFTYLSGTQLYTNIGKNKVYCYNIATKKRFSYNRTASIPFSISQNGSRVVILNDNGSISWCSTSNSKLLADWYLTTDDQWYEF